VADYDAVVLDGYELDPDLVAAVGTGAPVAWFDDDGDVPPQVALAIAPARVVPPGRDDPGVLAGLEHAPLGRRFWDPPHRETLPELARVLVTMGGTDARNKSAELAAVARDAAPSAEIALVRGPNSEPGPAPGGVSVIGPLPGLGDELAQSDLMIGAAGQTMLEAAALGTPALVAVAAPNQAAGARELELRGAVSLFDIDAPEDLRTRIAAMGDVERRRRMSAAGQEAVDGSGARRIARAVVALAAGDG
jgi:spore coat polysaccharide biosynthesis predicted glycosyltransferase SpsG